MIKKMIHDFAVTLFTFTERLKNQVAFRVPSVYNGAGNLPKLLEKYSMSWKNTKVSPIVLCRIKVLFIVFIA